MKPLNRKDISLQRLLLALLLAAALVGLGWFAWSQSSRDNSSEVAQEHAGDRVDGEDSAEDVHELRTVEDIDKLTPGAPESFVRLMTDNLEKNQPDENGCITVYQVSMISTVNIRGGHYYETNDSETSDFECGSGAPNLWVLTPAGDWDWVSRNGHPPCVSENGGLIYEEYAPECLEQESGTLVKNPNGSVTSLVN